MAAARFLVPPDNRAVRRVHEKHLIAHTVALHFLQHMKERAEKLPAARIDDENDLRDMAARLRAKLRELRDEHRRQIVHAEKPQILQITARLRLAAARHPRNDHKAITPLLHADTSEKNVQKEKYSSFP